MTWRDTYDTLRRPVESWSQNFATPEEADTDTAELLCVLRIYGEDYDDGLATDPAVHRLMGQTWRIYGGAGQVERDRYDVDGRLVRETGTFAEAYQGTLNWQALVTSTGSTPTLEASGATHTWLYDAAGRVRERTTPDCQATPGTDPLLDAAAKESGNLGLVDTIRDFDPGKLSGSLAEIFMEAVVYDVPSVMSFGEVVSSPDWPESIIDLSAAGFDLGGPQNLGTTWSDPSDWPLQQCSRP